MKEIKVSELDNFLPGIDCANLSVKVDQEVDGPVYSLETALTRPTYPEITAVSLVRQVIGIGIERLIISLLRWCPETRAWLVRQPSRSGHYRCLQTMSPINS